MISLQNYFILCHLKLDFCSGYPKVIGNLKWELGLGHSLFKTNSGRALLYKKRQLPRKKEINTLS